MLFPELVRGMATSGAASMQHLQVVSQEAFRWLEVSSDIELVTGDKRYPAHRSYLVHSHVLGDCCINTASNMSSTAPQPPLQVPIEFLRQPGRGPTDALPAVLWWKGRPHQ